MPRWSRCLSLIHTSPRHIVLCQRWLRLLLLGIVYSLDEMEECLSDALDERSCFTSATRLLPTLSYPFHHLIFHLRPERKLSPHLEPQTPTLHLHHDALIVTRWTPFNFVRNIVHSLMIWTWYSFIASKVLSSWQLSHVLNMSVVSEPHSVSWRGGSAPYQNQAPFQPQQHLLHNGITNDGHASTYKNVTQRQTTSAPNSINIPPLSPLKKNLSYCYRRPARATSSSYFVQQLRVPACSRYQAINQPLTLLK